MLFFVLLLCHCLYNSTPSILEVPVVKGIFFMAKAHHLVAMVGSDTVIGTGVIVDGPLRTTGDITIDGQVNGEVSSKGNVTIGINGHIHGKVSGDNVLLAGQISGDILASGETHLTESAKLIGDITTALIAIDTGANFLGTITMQEQPRLMADEDTK